ncbi:MAG: class I SAM-dependent methyltransferase [Ignavibacteriae bacterium]|jgi:2-polyprenyl-3-methyl-5-hydroxy-6-metoxy-1,4-benzoquinol methylase|nr:class I SAM-dependent methyltransferase [Ignavibacteriota bacterium]
MQNEWFKDWFSSNYYLDVYNHRNENDAAQIVNLILSQISLKENSNILDAACGIGRHAVKFAENKFNVTAFDLSKNLLSIAIQCAYDKNLKINFIVSDLRNFFVDEKFDLVANLFTSFGYFETDDENFKFVKHAFQMLNESGYYVLDFLNKEYLQKNIVPFSKKNIDGKRILESRKIVNGRVNKEILISHKDNEVKFSESVRLYSYNELVRNFSQIGFKIFKSFGDYNGNKFDEKESKRCIIIFQK